MNYTELTIMEWENLLAMSAKQPNMVVNLQLTPFNNSDVPYVCIFVSSDNSLHFLCEIVDSGKQIEIEDPNVAGLELSTIKNHFIIGRDRQSYYDLRCTGIHHKEEFTNMVREVCDLIFDKKFHVAKALITVFGRNTSFWGKPQNAILSEEEQRGLFGELNVLLELLRRGHYDAVSNWQGPLKSKHDFYFNKCSIEVKTTLSPRHKHVINGLEQLECEENRALVIASMKLIISENGENVSDLVRKIILELEQRPDLVENFIGLVKQYGFNNNHEELYTVYSLEDIGIFPISEDFPTFTRRNLSSLLSDRISRISYYLDMEGLPRLRLDNKIFLEKLK